MTRYLNLTLQRPAALCAAVSFLHTLAFICAMVSLSGVPLALVLSGVALSWYAQLKRLRSGVDALICRIDGGLELASPTRSATLTGAAVPADWLAIAQWRDDHGQRDALLVTPERTGADAFRRLRVWLRWHRVAEPESQN